MKGFFFWCQLIHDPISPPRSSSSKLIPKTHTGLEFRKKKKKKKIGGQQTLPCLQGGWKCWRKNAGKWECQRGETKTGGEGGRGKSICNLKLIKPVTDTDPGAPRTGQTQIEQEEKKIPVDSQNKICCAQGHDWFFGLFGLLYNYYYSLLLLIFRYIIYYAYIIYYLVYYIIYYY